MHNWRKREEILSFQPVLSCIVQKRVFLKSSIEQLSHNSHIALKQEEGKSISSAFAELCIMNYELCIE